MIIGRRGFITGLISLMAAPAIVRIDSIMPVKVMLPADRDFWLPRPPDFVERVLQEVVFDGDRIITKWRAVDHLSFEYEVAERNLSEIYAFEEIKEGFYMAKQLKS